jgi:phosphoglycolate phosphatase-like HAD superfamily hydrolase
MPNLLEIINPEANALKARVAVFDFDGTISIIRAGWIDVMVPMMVEPLLALKTGESEEEITNIVRGFVGQLTGRQTIYQMMEFADQIKKRGGTPKDPLEYKHQYLELLMHKITDRRENLRSGKADPEDWMVPGARRLLETLKDRGLTMYLASGTDQIYMREEADLLDVSKYFDGVYGALDDYKSFSKKILIERIIRDSEFQGEEFIGFGDGYVEIENVKEVGGVALGIASDEPECVEVDQVKRKRLIGVGADWIVPNFTGFEELTRVFFPGE